MVAKVTKLRNLFFYLLFFCIQFEPCFVVADAGFIQNSRNKIILDAPFTIKNENGYLSIEGLNGESVVLKGGPSINIKTEMDWKIYMPVIAAIITAIVTLFTGIYLSWKNHTQIKKQRWYASWSDRVLSLNDQLFELVNGSMFHRQRYKGDVISIEMNKIRVQICSYTRRNTQILESLNQLESVLKDDNLHQKRDIIFSNLSKIAKILFEEIKNG